MSEAFPKINYSERTPKTDLLGAIKIVEENMDTVVGAPFEIVLNAENPFTIDGLKAMGQLPIECLILKDAESGNVILNTGNKDFPQPIAYSSSDGIRGYEVLNNRIFSVGVFSLHNHPIGDSLPSLLDMSTFTRTNSARVNFIIDGTSISVAKIDGHDLEEALKKRDPKGATFATIPLANTSKMADVLDFLNGKIDADSLFTNLIKTGIQ